MPTAAGSQTPENSESDPGAAGTGGATPSSSASPAGDGVAGPRIISWRFPGRPGSGHGRTATSAARDNDDGGRIPARVRRDHAPDVIGRRNTAAAPRSLLGRGIPRLRRTSAAQPRPGVPSHGCGRHPPLPAAVRRPEEPGLPAGQPATGTPAGAEPPAGQRSLISPMPAHSRTASMPATAAALSLNAADTASSVPSGAVSRNRYWAAASTKTSNLPAITNPSGRRSLSPGGFAAHRPNASLRTSSAGLVERSELIGSSSASSLSWSLVPSQDRSS